MARSTYIYITLSDHVVPIAAFTVKKEMISWIRRYPGEYKVWRLRDGTLKDKLPTEITDEILEAL